MDDWDDTLSRLETQRGEPAGPTDQRVSLVLYHRDGTAVVPLERGVPVVIGRGSPSDVVIRDKKLSRAHARISWGDEGIFIEDLGSTNGTFHEGGRISSRAALRGGDEVWAGSVVITVNVLTRVDEERHVVDGYDAFSERLEKDVVSARVFDRTLALLLIRALGRPEAEHARLMLPLLRDRLRPVDYVGTFGPGQLLVAMPELSRDSATAVARVIAEGLSSGVPEVVVGVSTHPADGSSSEALVSAARAATRRATPGERVQSSTPLGRSATSSAVVVVDSEMRRIFDTVSRVARSSAPVLIAGETGVGKELVARAIHEGSPRRKGPFCAVNCGAIPVTLIESVLFGHVRGAFTGADRPQIGIFEQASGGTLFLDEAGELTPASQAALLRALDTKVIGRIGSAKTVEVDVRVVAATNRDLDRMVAEGNFRQDLLYRLNAVTLEIPPLRSRVDEIAPLAERFSVEAARDNGLPFRPIAASALEVLMRHSWPGNVRELRNAVERAVLVGEGEEIEAGDLPAMVRGESGQRSRPCLLEESDVEYKDRVQQYERELVLAALEKTGGNQTHAARLLRIPLRTLVYKLRSWGFRTS